VLLQIPGEVGAALPVLREALGSKKDKHRYLTIRSLGTPGAPAREVVPLLRLALRDKSELVSDEAIRLVEKLGPAARDAGPDLVPFLFRPVLVSDTHSSPVRRRALKALQ
jgi:HEAT repeat protein